MSCRCSGVCWMIGICIAQLITVAVRQTYDFLGLQWTAIAVNFCQIFAVVIALIGCSRSRHRLIAMYSAWTLIWLGWNLYLIFLYIGIGGLNVNDHVVTLNLGLSDTYTWFREKCMVFIDHSEDTATVFDAAVFSSDKFPWFCAAGFQYIEVGQSAVQLLLAVFGFGMSCYAIGVLREEEDSFDFIGSRPDSDMRKSSNDPNFNTIQSQPLVGGVSSSTNA
uniref:Sodium/potassium-transporting ATPase subunit beta-1-interacting protein n=1 Tax=Phallusia mammillata TaxID=59560 RepID=A0A6F9DMI0_9ASCI|nr:sodium/potassium-transporting ATPase subunit beta-1-interacting protein 3-like [Phallusia mammillata]